MRIAVVGAGLAGLVCATRLQEAGHTLALFDKGRGPGGRMATRRVATDAGDAAFDHGAQYFTVRDAGFRGQVEAWQRAGLVAPWPAAGAEAWVGTPAMNAPVRALAAELPVRWNTQVDALTQTGDGWRLDGKELAEAEFDAVVVAIPAEQAGPLLAPSDAAAAARARAAVSDPCWTVMAAFATPVAHAADIIRDDPVVGWAARNSAKPGRSGPESWVIQGSPDWSRTHLEQTPEAIVQLLLAVFGPLAGGTLPPLLSATAHRWRYARSGADGGGMIWNPATRLGACGDWLLGPRVECAWLSGTWLAAAMLEA